MFKYFSANRLVPLALFISVFAVSITPAAETAALSASDFLDSIGANSAIASRGETLEKTAECARYLGLRWIRTGTEIHVSIQDLIDLHKQTGLRYSWSPGSGGSNLPKLLETGRQLAAAGALLAFEGPNEPNNWGITYEGEKGGKNKSWLPVAKLQRDLYKAVKSDPLLKSYPVFSISEGGAETDNAGLQFLTIPDGAKALLPAGTQFADYANAHNYIYHPNSPHPEPNKTWNASDPTSACKVDGLYGNYGRTWARHFAGYSESKLISLPKVTTETGCLIGGEITGHRHALNLLTLYLDQFKRGWSYTAVYLLRDRVDEGGNQKFGFYKPDYSPREAALYLHNLTTILEDHKSAGFTPSKLNYSIPEQPATLHDLLLQKSNGQFELAVWNEQINATNTVTLNVHSPVSDAKLYDPTLGTKPIQTLSQTRRIPLALSDHPLILEFTVK
jgi:hypothetical protein